MNVRNDVHYRCESRDHRVENAAYSRVIGATVGCRNERDAVREDMLADTPGEQQLHVRGLHRRGGLSDIVQKPDDRGCGSENLVQIAERQEVRRFSIRRRERETFRVGGILGDGMADDEVVTKLIGSLFDDIGFAHTRRPGNQDGELSREVSDQQRLQLRGRDVQIEVLKCVHVGILKNGNPTKTPGPGRESVPQGIERKACINDRQRSTGQDAAWTDGP
jgi:hypothetical protein